MLLTRIREIAEESPLLDPRDTDREIRVNTWSFSAPREERSMLSAQDLATGFEECALIIRQRIRSLEYEGQATFYVWHDQQSGQLRCSITSSPRDHLPFGARVDVNAPLTAIMEEFLKDKSPGHVSWDELQQAEDEETDEMTQEFVLPVWVADVGAAP